MLSDYGLQATSEKGSKFSTVPEAGVTVLPGLLLQVPEHLTGTLGILQLSIPQQAGGKDDGKVTGTHLVDVLVLSNPK